MLYQFDYHPYRRPFKTPLHTSHGIWKIREGILIRLIDETDKIHLGEIAPISWFGSETLSQSLDFCDSLPSKITSEIIFSIPDYLPACQFGFESAIADDSVTNVHLLSHSLLLPIGEAALSIFGEERTNIKSGRSETFKWKIGVDSAERELSLCDRLLRALPENAKLRLDANCGLNWETAHRWLEFCETSSKIEFLEQPLGLDKFAEMLSLSQQYQTPIALDESVSTLERIKECYEGGWQGIFVIKAAIAGSPTRLKKFCQGHTIDTVFSSVFETPIGRKAAFNLASELQIKPRAIGFGVDSWFADGDDTWIEPLRTVR